MASVRVSPKFLVTIPKAIRDKLNIKVGQRFAVSEVDGSILLTPVPDNYLKHICGILGNGSSATKELLEERNRDLQHE
jgi:AbrB family looped-hinge helix DNA binding protein